MLTSHAGFSINWCSSPSILVYTFYDVTIPTVNQWAATFEAALDQQAPGQPLLTLFDVTRIPLTVTPHMRQLGIQTARHRPDVPGRVAIVMQHSYRSDMLRGFMSLLEKPNRGRQGAIFYLHDNAMAWLSELEARV